jgi:GTPase involved in cell partitioning and DNA repair
MEVYNTVRDELSRFDDELAKKPELVLLTKSDTRTLPEIAETAALFKALGKKIVIVSILDDASVKALQDTIVRALR